MIIKMGIEKKAVLARCRPKTYRINGKSVPVGQKMIMYNNINKMPNWNTRLQVLPFPLAPIRK